MATSLISNLYTEPKDLETSHSTHSLAELYVISNDQNMRANLCMCVFAPERDSLCL